MTSNISLNKGIPVFRDLEYQSRVQENEMEYPLWWSKKQITESFQNCPEDTAWNIFICVFVLVSIVFLYSDFIPYYEIIDLSYNVVYAVHVLGIAYNLYVNRENTEITCCIIFKNEGVLYRHQEVGDYSDLVWLRAHDQKPMKHEALSDQNVSLFFASLYLVNKIFIPIGATRHPHSDTERVLALFVTISGCLTMIGSAVASLSLAIGIYMRPEEAFRARYRLIMRDMKESNVPRSLSKTVMTFYKMYWHKMRAVSSTQLLPAFPPWLPTIVYTDIYFKATQKSRILCDLSYSFLCEVAKTMQTLHYIPGDVIIKRSTRKSSIIYITYGDVEMLTAEDDSTAVLRLSRGSVLSSCAGCVPAGCGKAHVEVRAATFCTAHLLHARDLWRIALKYGKDNGQAAIILASFYEHFERVKRHYYLKTPEQAMYKSSIREFKRNLMSLQGCRDAAGGLLLARTDIMLDIAGCYIMRNRADASLTDESDDICLRSVFPCILQPRSVLLTLWNSFVCCVIVAVCFTHPYYIAYKGTVPIQFRFYDYVVTCIYLLDLFVYLSTGERVEDGVPITLAQTASQQIRSHWFVLDSLATVPLLEFIHDGHFAGINKLLRLPKVFRMLKSLEDEWVYYSNFLRFFSYSLLLVMSCYFVAALQQGFMCFCFGHCSVTNLTHPPFWAHVPPDDASINNTLTFGLYWAISMITVTCHKETGAMSNWNNVLYAMLVLELCIILHIFMDAVYSATIMVATALKEDYDASITDVTNFLIRNDVEPILRQRFITYLQLGWYTDKGYRMTNKKSSIYFDLPPHVYQDIVNRQRSKYILCIPFMKYLSKEDLKTVSSQANMFYTSPNEILLNTGDISNEIYVIKQGICEIIDPDTKEVINELRPRNNFGVLECVLRIPAYYTVRAATHVQMFSISRKYLLKAIEIPQIKDAIEFAKEQPEYFSLQTRRQPFVSYMPPAPIPNVERFRLPRKHEHDYAFLQPFRKLGFLSVLRYIFPRFTIRPDSEYLMRAEWCRGCCAVMSALLIPGYPYLSFDSLPLYFTLLLLDCSAYFDILQRMLVGYYNEKGILVYHPASTADHYIRGAFLIDLFSCLPLELLETILKELYSDRYRVAVSWQYLMLNRLLQLYRLPAAVQGLDRYIRRDIVLVIKATPLFLMLLNVMTCCLVFHSVDIYTWYNESALLIEPRKDHGGSWVELFNDNFRFNITEDIWDLHLASFFWVTFEATTTGYNVINPSNFDIMKIMFTGMLVGAMLTTYFCVRIISIRSNVNKPLAAFQQHMKDMSAFMHRENLSPDLQKDVRAYYAYNWDKMGGLDYRTVLKLCDQITLRTDAILDIYGSTFAMCPILGQCDKSLLRIIGRAVHSVHFLKHTVIVEKDDVIKDICFVDSGSVELIGGAPDAPSSVMLTKGSIFGDLDGELSHRSAVSLVSLSKVHLLQINANTFYNIVSDFPDVMQLMKSYRPHNEKYIKGSMDKDSVKITKDKKLSLSNLHQRIGKGFLKHIRVKNVYIQSYLIIVSLLSVVGDTYNAGFQDNNMLFVLVLYALDMAFCLKFLILYILPFITRDDDVVHSVLRPKVHRYSKLETKFDIVSCLPTELLCFLSHENRGLLFSFLRLNRIFRVVTLYKGIYRHHERLGVNMTLMTVYTVSVWFSLFVHITSCCWYFIGYLEDRAKPKSSWIYKNDGSSWCGNHYLCSMYFVLMTFAQNGVGDILPKNRSEVVFVIILQIVSAMVFLIYVGEFSNIFQHQSFRSFEFFCKYLELQEYLKNNRVSKNLVKLVNKYSLHVWRQSRGVQVPHFLRTAPQCLRLRLMSAAFIHHLNNSIVFKNCEPAFLRQLVGCLHLYTYNEGMFVVRQHEITDSMYFIHTGRVSESREEDSTTKVYHLGNCFGVMQGLTHDLQYSHSYRTITKCQILTLNLKDWEGLLKHFPKSNDSMVLPSSFVGGPPGKKDRKMSKDKRERKVQIVNTNDHPPSDKKVTSTEPMTLSPTENKLTEPGPSASPLGASPSIIPQKDEEYIESTMATDSKKLIPTLTKQNKMFDH
ncbi:Potassium voltage-gated channel subfamily H member 1 [Papilio xuthus]|uniref:Potassium voltage-gated channel subfamily H member 1 n=1 Tax=Papilio xuthus TaxID=66420 RepID=A0A194PZM3_PAPXU|nr:Potassium voltage-gated channel subfamily H member 1 [Papilio xuthus]